MRQIMNFRSILIVAAAVCIAATATAQPAPGQAPRPRRGRDFGPRIVSPEVHPDRTVTFRLRAPKAREVSMWGEVFGGKTLAKDAQGVWSVTVGPLAPKIYDYKFTVDGVGMADPANPEFKNQTTSLLLVPGEKPELFEMRPVPHGTVTMHWYESKSVGTTRRIFVYTPPDYDRDTAKKYPVFYLLHGSGDNEGMWTHSGKANLILDNLLAEGKARPMIVVMPNGHTPRPAQAAAAPFSPRAYTAAFENDLLKDVIPLVESRYRVLADTAHRAIAGLSMGGMQSGFIGLNHPELFGYVGIWSMGGRDPDATFKTLLERKAESDKNLKLLWIGCGRGDNTVGFASAEQLSQWMTAHGIKNVWRPSEGAHEWSVWRMYLGEFLPLLFKE